MTDGGGTLILVSAECARDFPQRPVYLLGAAESVPDGQPNGGFNKDAPLDRLFGCRTTITSRKR